MQVLYIHNGNTGEWIRFREYFTDEVNGIRFDLTDLSERGQSGYYFVENTTRKSGGYGWYGVEQGGTVIYRWAGDRWLRGVVLV